MSPASHLDLLPHPRFVRILPGACRSMALPEPVAIDIHLAENVRRGLPFCDEFPAPPPDASWYALSIRPSGIHLRADDDPGLLYGLTTLAQLIRAAHRRATPAIATMKILDWPDFPVRGLMLDISRDKVPKMSELLRIVDGMAALKMNQLQLYTEHAFAYRGHERVWRGASPITAAQIRRLNTYCHARGIDLVPNQNSFGHMERWLRHEPYRRLAETRRPWKTPWGATRDQPSTLCPADPGSMRLVRDLYRQLLPNFSSGLFNVGCDETFELGQGRSRAQCRRRGRGRIYLDHLLRIHRETRRRRKRMMFWADMLLRYPDLVRRIPKDAIPLIWGYEADHPFDKECRRVARGKLDFYVCPGTSSWCSFAGRLDNALANIRNAADAGLRHGAKGFLVTDWGDFGHRQYAAAGELPLLYAAAVSWCARSNRDIDVADEATRHAIFAPLSDPAGMPAPPPRQARTAPSRRAQAASARRAQAASSRRAQAASSRRAQVASSRRTCKDSLLPFLWRDAGNLYLLTGKPFKNATLFFKIIDTPLSEIPRIPGLRADRLRRALRRINSICSRLAAADSLRAAGVRCGPPFGDDPPRSRRAASKFSNLGLSPRLPDPKSRSEISNLKSQINPSQLLATRELAATLAVLRHSCRRALAAIAQQKRPLSRNADREQQKRPLSRNADREQQKRPLSRNADREQQKRPLSRNDARRLAEDMRRIIAAHRELWRARNRPGGLSDSIDYYKKLLIEYDALLKDCFITGRYGHAATENVVARGVLKQSLKPKPK